MSAAHAETLPLYKLPVTIEEYLTWDADEDVQYEFLNGVMRAMATPTKRHNLLVGNLREHLGPSVRRRGCMIYTEKVKLKIEVATGSFFYYPDLLVRRGSETMDARYEEDASLIVEVLSLSTRHTDRAEKFFMYQQLPSFSEYVMVEQDEVGVTILRKSTGWKLEHYDSLEQSVRLESLDCELRVADVYAL